MRTSTFIILLILSHPIGYSQQKKQYKIRTIAFYNVENLFDTINDPTTRDDDHTPLGKDRWTSDRYHQKIAHIAKVLSEIGSEISNTSPDIIGLSEIENQQVLEDLIHHPNLQGKNYGIVHYDSPDERGIDVALLYKKTAFIPSSFKSRRLLLTNDEGFRDYTRDQLVVGGFLDNEQIYFTVNHWPSRSGGEFRSRPNRIAAAQLNKRIIDSIIRVDHGAKIISMGDLNDDPISPSLKKILKTKGKKQFLTDGDLYNPMEQLYKKGAGSLAYRDQWFLFDQLFFTGNFIHSDRKTFTYWKAGIYHPSYLLTKNGHYTGYPFRTYAGGNYSGGYSDHFPVYLYLIKEVPSLTSANN